MLKILFSEKYGDYAQNSLGESTELLVLCYCIGLRLILKVFSMGNVGVRLRTLFNIAENCEIYTEF